MLISILDDVHSEAAFCAELLAKHIPGAATIEFDDETAMMSYFREPDLLPDLILLELHMPGLDTWQIVQDLRNYVTTKDIPLAFYSRSKNPKDFLFACRLDVPLFLKGASEKESAYAVHNLSHWYKNRCLA